MTAPNCKGKCTTREYPDALKHLQYWDQLGYKRCQNCEIIISIKDHKELTCKCCNGRFRIKCRVAYKRNGKGRYHVDHSIYSCYICGFEFKNIKTKQHVYRFDPKTPGIYICSNCYQKRRYNKNKYNE